MAHKVDPNNPGTPEVHPIDAVTRELMEDDVFDDWVDKGRPTGMVYTPLGTNPAIQSAGDPWAFDTGIFGRYSSMVYPVHPSWDTKAGSTGLIDANRQQYDYMALMAQSIIDTIVDRTSHIPGAMGVAPSGPGWTPGNPDYPEWYTSISREPGDDIFGNDWDPDTYAFAAPDANVQRFMAWWEGVNGNENWLPTLASAAYRMASETDTALNYIEVGAPGLRENRIFNYDNVVRLITKYGVDFLDLSGPHGYGLLETAALNDLALDPLFDIASTAVERHRSTRTVSTNEAENIQGDREAIGTAVRSYARYIGDGYNHVQAKIFAFGGYGLGMRVMAIGDGTADSDLTGEEIGQIMGILGPNWQQELSEMDPFDAQDPVGAYKFAGYMDTLVNRGPVEVQGEAMREAARTLASGWRMQPLSDNELDQMVLDFGAKLQEARMMPPVWSNIPHQAGRSPGHPAGPAGTLPSAAAGITEVPNMSTAMATAVRGSPDYERLYGGKPSGMGEEEWISRFAGASQSLTGLESRAATEAGMQTGDMTSARQVALTDESSRGGAWYRRMAAWRGAFE